MKEVSRRGFLKQAGVTAAVAVTGAGLATTPAGIAGALGHHAAPEPALTPEEEKAVKGDLIAQITNAGAGEINVFVGERQVTLRDKSVVARLVRAAK